MLKIAIQLTCASMARTTRKIDEILAERDWSLLCCPSCASPKYRALTAKLERQAEWLCVLFHKSGECARGDCVARDYMQGSKADELLDRLHVKRANLTYGPRHNLEKETAVIV